MRKNHFIQAWCNDSDVRRRAVQERVLGMARLYEVRTRADLAARAEALAGQLEVPPPSMDDLRAYARTNEMRDHLRHLDALE
ncbi:hypothetical protein [Sphaerisporangium krabiense]|uniref:Uncharacterized protein n=1 Tax=Sphaerisporangium krabiense TaxID=763782 RepID=A0A7W8Z7U9_9ACTN|nr:hypothetical protein [Sphaerisporangium krabiense]MBB5628905.1 hypothetical protein [Sphaerisporangium krabiense]